MQVVFSTYYALQTNMMTPHSPIRILIIEDQTLMRQGLKTILELEPGLRVVGTAADGEEGVRLALALRPDSILMDVQMPRLNGVQATSVLKPMAASADHSHHL